MNNVPLTLQCFETDEDFDTNTRIRELLRCPSEPLEVTLKLSEMIHCQSRMQNSGFSQIKKQ